MKKKILIYLDGWFTHFGISEFLQKKYDCELFGIVDFGKKSLDFFKNQDIVKFNNLWYYNTSLENLPKSPDIEYLSSFEERYGIDIWKLAYEDRKFYHRYNEFYKFNGDEILSIIENECKFFESIINETKPDFYLTFYTQGHNHHLPSEICKSKNIPVLMMSPVKFGYRMMISEDPCHFDADLNVDTNPSQIPLDSFLKKHDNYEQTNQLKDVSFESKKFERYNALLNFFLKYKINQNFHFSYYGMTKLKIIKSKIKRNYLRNKRTSFIEKNFKKDFDDEYPYIYFPLHYEPERVLFRDAYFYADQLAIITNIAKSLPIEYKLYVKEHPMMKTIGWRDLSFYKFLMKLPNVELVHPSIPPEKIIKNSSMVITIASTAGQEAAFYKKPTIAFADELYTTLPSVQRIGSMEELPSKIRNGLSTTVFEKDLENFIGKIDKKTFEFDIHAFTSDFAYRFGFKGPIMDSNLPKDEIRKFLDDHKQTLEHLADEHWKKINFFKTKQNIV
jgi:hypothetical protein